MANETQKEKTEFEGLPMACNSTPHETLIAHIMNPNIAKDEYHHAAAREIKSLRAKNKELRSEVGLLARRI